MMTVSCLQGLRLLRAASSLVPPPPRRWLLSAPFRGLGVLCAAFCAAVLLTVPAFAGHWDTQYTRTGNVDFNWSEDPYSGSWSNDWSMSGLSGNDQAEATMTCTLKTHGTVTATLTWVPDSVQDAPPSKIWLYESASASWSSVHDIDGHPLSGSRSVSLGGRTDCDYNNYSSSAGIGGAIAKHNLTEVGCAGGFITRTCTVAAEVDSNGSTWVGDEGEIDYWQTGINVGGNYSVSIHAHPYNFRLAPRQARFANPRACGPGEIQVEYQWSSTDGNLDSLANIQIDENTDYSGNPGEYIQDSYTNQEIYLPPQPMPFFMWSYRNPTKGRTRTDWLGRPDPTTVPGSAGDLTDYHLKGGMFALPGEPLMFNFTAKQVYEYHCSDPDCMGPDEWRPIEDGPEAKEHTITRTLRCMNTDPSAECWWVDAVWEYKTTKDTFTAWQTMTRFRLLDYGPPD